MNQYIYTLALIFACYQLSSAQNTPVNSSVFDCSTAQPPAVNCQVDPNCLYPNPRNCSTYYQCSNGQAYRMECPEYQAGPPKVLLVFDPSINRCTYPEDYDCPLNAEPVETTTELEEEETTTEAPEQESTTAPPVELPETTTRQPEQAPEQPETTTPSEEAPQPDPTTAPPAEEAPEQPETTTPSEEAPQPDPSTAPPAEEAPETTTGPPEPAPEQPATTSEAPSCSSSAPPPEAPPSTNPCLSPEAQSNLTAGCPAPRNCMFPNPQTCQGYVQCQANGANPIQYNMSCPLGNDNDLLYWNDNTLTCERKENSTCVSLPQPPEANPCEETTTEEAPEQPTTSPPAEEAPEQPTTSPPAEEAPETTSPPAEEAPDTTTVPPEEAPQPEPTTEEPADETTTVDDEEDAPTPAPTTDAPPEDTTTETTTPPTSTTTAAPTTTTAAPTTTTGAPPTEPPESGEPGDGLCQTPEAIGNQSLGCPGPRFCMFPVPNNCSVFIQCPEGHPTGYIMPCAMGPNNQPLYWNDITLRCEYPEDSTCPDKTIETEDFDRKPRSILFGGLNMARALLLK